MTYDFEGWVTKNDIKCSDGRVIRHDAFAQNDGARVPLVFQHNHSDINGVVGFVDLALKPDGMWGAGSLNSTPNGAVAKELIKHGDITSLSIYANQLSERDGNVYHGNIREVSLVLAGANPGARIDPVSVAHSDGSYELLDDEAVVHTGLLIDALRHAATPAPTQTNDSGQNETAQPAQPQDATTGQTVADVWNAFDDDQKNLVLTLIADSLEIDVADVAKALDEALAAPEKPAMLSPEDAETVYNNMTEDQQKVAGYIADSLLTALSDQNSDQDTTETSVEHDGIKEDDMTLKKNVFEGSDTTDTEALSHSDLNEFLKTAEGKHVPSMRDYVESGEYAIPNVQGDALSHSITDVNALFPDAKPLDAEPAFITRDQSWVGDFLDATKKSPFSNIKSVAANLTADEARAKGYIKGQKKVDEVFPLLKRTTSAKTVYKHQSLERDDLLDITDFDVVVWLKREMTMMLREELARAAFVGDGRTAADKDKISEDNIRPMFSDSDVYTIHYEVGDEATADDGIVDDVVRARKNYQGSGNPTFYATNDVITMLLLTRDKMGRRLYANETDLAAAMRVNAIVEVPVMNGATRATGGKTFGCLGIIVNPRDYVFGAVSGAQESFFDDFDLDFNQYKYLLETRTCGALTVPHSAIALEFDTAKYKLTNGVLSKGAAAPSGH